MDAAIESPPRIYRPQRTRRTETWGSRYLHRRSSGRGIGVVSGRGRESAKLQLIAAVLDKKGRILLRDTQDTTEHRRLSPSGNGGAGLARLEIRVSLPEAAIRLRFVLRDLANGLMGTADMQIPTAANPGGSYR